MKNKVNGRRLLILSMAFFLLFGISFLLMPLGGGSRTGLEETGPSAMTLLSGGLFWASLLGGIVTQVMAAAQWRAWRKKNSRTASRGIGIFSFFRNKFAMAADITVPVSLIALIIAMKLTNGAGYICFVLIGLLTFSFSMHCICNGKVFRDLLMPEERAAGKGSKAGNDKNGEETK